MTKLTECLEKLERMEDENKRLKELLLIKTKTIRQVSDSRQALKRDNVRLRGALNFTKGILDGILPDWRECMD